MTDTTPSHAAHSTQNQVSQQTSSGPQPPSQVPPGIHVTFTRLLAFALAALGLLLAARVIEQRYRYEQTDDASVEGRHTLLAPKVAGIVTKVRFDDNEEVQAGQPLVELDPRDYQNALGVAKAELAAAQAHLKDANIKFHESQALATAGAINAQRKDTDEARFVALQAEVARIHHRIDQLKVDLDYATLRAPSAGKVGRRQVEPGMYANAGQALVSFVAKPDRWVVANFKETQLRRIHVGSQAEVRIDAIADKVFAGVVESLSPTSGAIFSLLPPDNATGNYIKIVQRVPVRIALQNLSAEDVAALQVGLNADVRVCVH